MIDKQNEMDKKIKKLETHNKELKNENEELKTIIKEKKEINTNNGTINNNTNTVNNNGVINNFNIKLVAYGKEEINKLTKEELLEVFKLGFYSSVKLTESLHFNPKYPEYHNIYISNIKDKYAMMFDGKQWNLTFKEELIDRIYEDKKNYIEDNMELFVNSLPPSRKNALKRWIETSDENDKDPKIKDIKEKIKLLLYNNRELITDSKAKYTTALTDKGEVENDDIKEQEKQIIVVKKKPFKKIKIPKSN